MTHHPQGGGGFFRVAPNTNTITDPCPAVDVFAQQLRSKPVLADRAW